jgi:hypothetical protein
MRQSARMLGALLERAAKILSISQATNVPPGLINERDE